MSAPDMATTAVATAKDWRTLDLDAGGRSLIEASAGTGKTWAISVLFLRLLLERQLSPRQVVVTTFTNAAAEELRERLRARVLWALRQSESCDGGLAEAGTSDEAWLFARWQADVTQKTADVARLKLALSEFDVAPISTLHGLCHCVLADHPFASGMPFVLGDLADGRALVAEVVQDLWRRLQQGGDDDALVGQFAALGFDPGRELLAGIVPMLLTPGARIPEGEEETSLEPLDGSLADTFVALAERKDIHVSGKRKLKDAWRELGGWLRDQSVPTSKVLIQNLQCAGPACRDEFLLSAASDPAVQSAIDFSLAACIPRLLRIAGGKPRHPPQALALLAREARGLLLQRLAAANQLGFDELIMIVHRVLTDVGDPARARALADALFATWPVALVDEFQDTDSLQYAILDRIYRDVDGQPRGRLVMIGDPKQSIYRFRGGDIHAYLRAAATAAQAERLNLQVNHRSSRALVAGFNEWYALSGSRLSAEADGSPIHYLAVLPSDRQDATPYTVAAEPVSRPLQFHYQQAWPESVGERRDMALETCANQIAALLQSGEHRIGGTPVQPGDIAVLLPKNAQLEQLRALLRERGVPSVTTSRASVFCTDIARELQLILHAVVHCNDLGALRAALATRSWGESYTGLQALGDDPSRWQALTAVFRDWKGLWRQRGVQSVVMALLDRVAARFLDAGQGERALTDLRHLGELLQEQSEEITGAEELLAWFAQQRAAGGGGDDEAMDARQLRIESDAGRVRLMTLHVSKGLEFPIVFLPLMWDHKPRKATDLCLLGDERSEGRRVLSTRNSFDDDMREQQDESFRVLYVALTRAIHACHVFVLSPERPATGGKNVPPATGTARSALDAMLARMQPGLDAVGRDDAAQHVRWIDGWGPVERQNFTGGATPDCSLRHAVALPTPPPGPLPSRHSFTTLTRSYSTSTMDPEAPANDESAVAEATLSAPEATEDEESVAVAAPHPEIMALKAVRGADFGNAVHAIFEQRVPGLAMAAQVKLIEAQLADNNVKHKELPPERLLSLLATRLQAVLDFPLGATDGPRLATLAAGDLRAEMEFNFALGAASLKRLGAVCTRDHGEPELIPANATALTGLMNGKIDLVFRHDGRFHVLDYKGNYLGDSIEDYRGPSLRAAMDKSSYRFQALLYAVAVDRYLRQRIAGYKRREHLGDCWYVFIRAVGLSADAGVWRHRFADGLLDAVDRELGHDASGAAA